MPAYLGFRLGIILLAGGVVSLLAGDWISVARAEPASRDRATARWLTLADPSATSSVALGVYRPSFPDDLRPADEYERAAGAGLPLIHWYALWGGWKAEFNPRDLAAVNDRGSVPLISWEPWAGRADDPEWSLRGAILSGSRDAYIDSWARGLAAYGRPVLLRFAHEMHDQAYPWALGVNGNSAEDYVAAWRHVHDIFARRGATNVKWVWNPNTLGTAPVETYEPIYRSLYPGDTYVDWVGLDVYNTGPNLDWGAPGWRAFADILAAPYQAIGRVTDKPLLLPEVGCAETGGSKAEWIKDALAVQVARFPRVRALVWFDVNKEERWALHSSAQALAAWTTAAGQTLIGW